MTSVLAENQQAKAEDIADECIEYVQACMKKRMNAPHPWQPSEIDETEFFKEIRWQIVCKMAALDLGDVK